MSGLPCLGEFDVKPDWDADRPSRTKTLSTVLSDRYTGGLLPYWPVSRNFPRGNLQDFELLLRKGVPVAIDTAREVEHI